MSRAGSLRGYILIRIALMVPMVWVLLTVVFLVAGALLLWGSNFAADYVGDELESQQIFFPPEEALLEEGRDDLVQYAGEQVTTGQEAEAYASFIDGHLPEE